MDDHTEEVLASLPSVLPVFPLTGCLLLPRGHLPLHIFEPRYRALTEAALGNGRVIGMVQPRDADADLAAEWLPIYDTGCAGRIVQFAETEDGRFFISLRGVCRFRIVEEVPAETTFRTVRPDFDIYRDDIEPIRDTVTRRERLIAVARKFLEDRGLEADWSAINDASDEALVTALAMTCPFEPREKQALLESSGLSARADLLISIMEIAITDFDVPPGGVLQ